MTKISILRVVAISGVLILMISGFSQIVSNTYGLNTTFINSSIDHFQSSDTVGNITNLSSKLSSLLVWAAGIITDGKELIITGGNSLVAINVSNPVNLINIDGTIGYTQFTQYLNTEFLIGGTDGGQPGGVLLYSISPNDSSVKNINFELPNGWTEQGKNMNLMSMSGYGNYTFLVVEQNGNANGTSHPQIGLLDKGDFKNITNSFPTIPANGDGYYSAYGGGYFLLLTDNYGFLYNVSTGIVTNVSSMLHESFNYGVARFLPSGIAWINGQFFIAYSTSLVSFNPTTKSFQILFTPNKGAFLTFVTDIGDQVYLGEEIDGSFTEIYRSLNGSVFSPIETLWGFITDAVSFDDALWVVGMKSSNNGIQSVLYALLAAPVLETVKITPSNEMLLPGSIANFSAIPYFSGLYNYNTSMIVKYNWSLSNNLGTLNRSYGSSVSFRAGSTIGEILLFANATFNNTIVESTPVEIQIVDSFIQSVLITHSSFKMASNSSIDLIANPIFMGENYSNETNFVWLLSNGIGHLNNSFGRKVTLYSGIVGGDIFVHVNATYNGKTVESNPILIQVFSEGSVNSSATSIYYLQYTQILPESSSFFNLVPHSGNIGVSFGIMGGTGSFNLIQGSNLISSFTISGGPINYNVTASSNGFAYVNFIGNSSNLKLSVTSLSSRNIVIALNEYNGFISNWTASMITDPPQWGLTFLSADGPTNNTGMSFTIIAPTDNSVWMASSINEGYGNIWSAQVGFNRDVGNNTVSYAGWGVDFKGVSRGGQDPNLPLTPGKAYNFTMELLYGTTWGFFVNGIPINDTGIGYTWNMTTTTAQDGDVGIETSSVHSSSLNLTNNVIISVASEFRSGGKWQRSNAEYLAGGVMEDWYNGNYSIVPTLYLWNAAGHLENSSIPNGTIEIGQSQPPIFAPQGLGYEPFYGDFTLTPSNQGFGILNTSLNGNNVTLIPNEAIDYAGVYSLNDMNEVINVFNIILHGTYVLQESQVTENMLIYGSTISGNATREIFLHRSDMIRLFNISFYEIGLPSGTSWSITLNNITKSSTNGTITFSEPNGTYYFTLATNNKDYTPNKYSGTFVVNGTPVSESVNFVLVTYKITFIESGLPLGTSWSVTLNGTTELSNNSTIAFSVSNGSFSYTIEKIISGGSGVRYISSITSGIIIVNGSYITLNITYSTQFYLTMSASNENGGSITPASGWFNAGSTITINAIPNSNFEFVSWSGIGNGSYSGINNSATITMNGPVTEQANFTELYSITFTESGLSSGTIWYVNLSNGQSFSSSSNTMTFNEPNGTYSYTISTINKEYAASNYSGSFTVNGSNIIESIAFNLVTYKIAFTESGLSTGTSWSLTLDNITKSSTNGTITFSEPNGTYSYSISGISGYRTTTYSGTISINGNPVYENITWAVIFYPITITESGIPYGTSWSATITGTAFNSQYINVTLSSTNNTITFNEPNGTYSYTLHLPSGYTTTNQRGNITVSGQSLTSSINAKQSSSSNTLSNYSIFIIIGIIVIIAAVIAAVMAMRRKK